MTNEEQEQYLRENTFDFFIQRKDQIKGLKRDWVYADIEIHNNRVQYEGSLKVCIDLIKLLKGEA